MESASELLNSWFKKKKFYGNTLLKKTVENFKHLSVYEDVYEYMCHEPVTQLQQLSICG